MILEVKVVPHSSKNEIVVRWEEGRLVVKVRGVPEKGGRSTPISSHFWPKRGALQNQRFRLYPGKLHASNG